MQVDDGTVIADANVLLIKVGAKAAKLLCEPQ
jgi:hypothetical protein